MTKFTKEQLHQIAEDGFIKHGEAKAMARQLLASMEQEPVAYMHHSGQVVTREECCDDKIFAICCKVETPLYAAPQLPQPAVPDIATVETTYPDVQTNWQDAKMYAEGWNACRAAMLQGAEPVTTAYKLPAEAVYGYFAFNDHHGEEFFKNREDAIAFCKEAIEEYRQENAEEGCDPDEVRRTCWGIIMQEGTDIEVDNEGHIDYALTPELDGNSTVIPDGWRLVPEEPTHEMLEAGDEQFGTYDVYRRMISAAPQQEVNK